MKGKTREWHARAYLVLFRISVHSFMNLSLVVTKKKLIQRVAIVLVTWGWRRWPATSLLRYAFILKFPRLTSPVPGRCWRAAKKEKTREGVLPAVRVEFTLWAQMPPDPAPFYVQVFLNMKFTIYPPSQKVIKRRSRRQRNNLWTRDSFSHWPMRAQCSCMWTTYCFG